MSNFHTVLGATPQWLVGDLIRTRSGGPPMTFAGWANTGIAACVLRGRTYHLPYVLLCGAKTPPPVPRKGRRVKRRADASTDQG